MEIEIAQVSEHFPIEFSLENRIGITLPNRTSEVAQQKVEKSVFKTNFGICTKGILQFYGNFIEKRVLYCSGFP